MLKIGGVPNKIAKLRGKIIDNQFMKTFNLTSEYIPLIQLLKATKIAQSGGEAQMLVEQGLVQVNDKPENRKRAKLRDGDIVKCEDEQILIKRINPK